MRLFIAIALGNEDYFKEIQEQMPKIKASYPKNFHLTLQFLGETSKKDEIIKELSEIKFEQFRLKTTPIGVFPNESRIRIVWLGLEDNEILKKLQKDVEKHMNKLGFKSQYEEFKPHITLARIKFLKYNSSYMEKLKEIKFNSKEFEINKIKLIKSELTSEGPKYTEIL